jgi:L-ascorbate metabolism protein UlaG (beta-lactamase superfamily)
LCSLSKRGRIEAKRLIFIFAKGNDKKTMDITWYGHSCLRLKDRNTTVVTDPYDKTLGLSLPRLKADVVTVSHANPHHNYVAGVKGDFKVIDSPGEYEIGGVFITGINLTPLKKRSKSGQTDSKNIVYVIYLDDIAVCHLGDLKHVPNQNQVEDMGSIDVLMVPVGGHKALNAAQAAEVISLIEPYIVIPIHYRLPDLAVNLEPIDKFLKEMGVTKAQTETTLKLSKTGLPEETQIVLMEPKF